MLETGTHYPLRLDSLPKGWRAGYVGDFAKTIEPGFASGEHNQTGAGIPHLRPMNVDRDGKINLTTVKYVAAAKDTRRLAVGDVLFNNTNSPELVGKTAVINQKGDLAFSNHMTRVLFNEEVLPKFAALQLHFLWMRGYFRYNCVKHVNQASISSTTLARAVPFIWAPVIEQERIVAEIEKQFSRLDEAVADLNRVKSGFKGYKATVLKAAVEGRLVPTERPWTEVKLGEIALSIRNGYSKKPDAEQGTRIFRISAVRPLELDVADVRYLSGDPADYEPFLVAPGDVLFTRYNGTRDYVGVCAQVPTELLPTVYPDKLIRIRVPITTVLPAFLVIAASIGRARTYIESKIRTTAGQSGISGGDLKSLPLNIPRVTEQHRIVAEVDRCLSMAAGAEAQIEANLLRAAWLRDATLRNAFSA